MNKVVLVCLVLYGGFLHSQISGSSEIERIDNSTLHNIEILQTGNFARVVNQKKDIKGSIHLFENWNNDVVIRTFNKKSYIIKNFNFNVKDNNFESKVGNDSVFIFDFKNVDFVHINSRKFKKIYQSSIRSERIFEIIYERNSFSLIKEYNSILKINDPDPLMFKKNLNEYRIRGTYYLKEGNNLIKFKLRKKNILEVMKSESSKVEEYAKVKGLSFKKDDDLRKIFDFYDSL